MQKYFRSIFGSNENFKICFRDLLTFSKYCLLGEGATFQIRILVEFVVTWKNVMTMEFRKVRTLFWSNFHKLFFLGWLNGNQKLGKLVILPINQNVDVFSTI